MQEREENRAAKKYLVCCTYFLTRHHLYHLVVCCGARELLFFVENASRNAVYISQGAVVEFYRSTWNMVEESSKGISF